jgi:hypothetical protein
MILMTQKSNSVEPIFPSEEELLAAVEKTRIAREKKRAYNNAYSAKYRARPEIKAKIKAYHQEYYSRPDIKVKTRTYYREYYQKNIEKMREYARKYRANKRAASKRSEKDI